MTYLGEGWDSTAVLVGGWVERRPRRREIGPQLVREATVMPWLAPRLPLPVPVPRIVSADPVVARHAFVPGGELSTWTAPMGRQLGEFLLALHAAPAGEAARLGVTPTPLPLDRFLAEVRVPGAGELLARLGGLPADTLVHGDLNPEHVLGHDGLLTGVIDFGDLHLGDPATDLAWALHDTSPEFADALAEVYGVTDALCERAAIWHALTPWYDVLRGNDTDDPEMVQIGLAGVQERLRRWVSPT
ncbi:Predicted kinase, aminoglycoside phosphotransferase (APT) family [Lentzea fradiae]|uniref:Predicted kinase, aminoglycoside phosphotransferase (APT) family n=1 Tax=Lentzea fradiae TaxID=200378 RepID=A0A1G7NUL6_9PSEU|nr:aminoglycoside phosphotransferase family protein [Lentzea fradiae]SDF77736.1 Predicted kinase, aminoglycoside phosphotransferase (APT) family [Lentzea fradiae]